MATSSRPPARAAAAGVRSCTAREALLPADALHWSYQFCTSSRMPECRCEA